MNAATSNGMKRRPGAESPNLEEYHGFLHGKVSYGATTGFEPVFMHDGFFAFQRALAEWAVRKGRAAIFAGCGLGKSLLELVWAENMVHKTGKPVLILTPPAVAWQFVQEGEKFGIECRRTRGGTVHSGINVTNYEQLHHYDPTDFGAAAGDESGAIKDFTSRTRQNVTEFFRRLPYRLLATATPAPNDYVELGNSSEALGEMGFQDMITRFFIKEVKKDYLGWGRNTYRMRGHAVRDFWRWVCSWARACRMPSDLGFDDGPFVLPELVTREHEVKANLPAPGWLFDMPAQDLREQQAEQRRTIPERCAKVAELVDHREPAIVWCHLNDEADLCERLIPGAVQVSGSDSDDRKEEVFAAFSAGQIRVLVTKPKLGGWGLNWQHCAHQTFFPSHSFEAWFQCVRRSWRFGQTRRVLIDVVTTEGATRVMASLRRKNEQADRMFAELVFLMNDSLKMGRSAYGDSPEEVPGWLQSVRN
jgi:hypothetical protein